MTAPLRYVKQAWPVPRQHQRRVVEAKLTIETSQGEVRGWCEDLSEGGISGTSAAQLTCGELVVIRFVLPGTNDQIEAQALVRFVNGFRCGFEFASLREEQRALIAAYIAATPDRKIRS